MTAATTKPRPEPVRLAVAYSGGRDSTALLHAVARAARGSAVQVHALHVHHGLSPHADAWQAHCHEQCRRWSRSGLPVTCHVQRVDVSVGAGLSIEAEARRSRYAALASMARSLGCETVLLAQHLDDQAETVLLQALRGAGAAGLSAMPRVVFRDGLTWVRPWLAQPRSAIEAYLRRYRLRYVDDDSNADPTFARNRLRLAVWPALIESFPQASQVLSQVAAQAQDALELLDAQAASDMASVTEGEMLRIAPWAAWPASRRRNLLRVWMRQVSGLPASRVLIERLALEVAASTQGRWPSQGGEWRSYRGRLRWVRAVLPECAPPAGELQVALVPGLKGDLRLKVSAWAGTLEAVAVGEGGVPLAQLGALVLRQRQEGDRFQRAPSATARALKKEFQWAGVPAWQRLGPVVCDTSGRLLFVPGLGMDARCWAPQGQAQWQLRWVADAPG